ncbi:hypothetical protein EC988_000570 [Linderina pennispora]|nr:hypothetical protein EC988_000570 [Linderina pennispora]
MTSIARIYKNMSLDYASLLDIEEDINKRKIIHDTMASTALIVEYHTSITALSEDMRGFKSMSKRLRKKIMYSTCDEEVISRYKQKYSHILAMLDATGVELRAKCKLFREERMVLDFLQASILGTSPVNAPTLARKAAIEMSIPNEELMGTETGDDSCDQECS